MPSKIRKWIVLPLDDYLAGLGTCLVPFRPLHFLFVVMSAALMWWLYVPIHELLHAAGCLLGGGEVYKIELSRLYGAGYLSKIFPTVTEGVEYAGRLSGFETHGNDLTYLLTDFFPYILTVLIGIPLLRSVGRRSSLSAKCIQFGVALPLAYSPFISVAGDYFEMGSIVISRAGHILFGIPLERWRGDDLFRIVGALSSSAMPAGAADIFGLALSLLLGILLIYGTYLLGVYWSSLMLKQGSPSAPRRQQGPGL